VSYAPRPGLSPAVATALAAGLIRESDRVLEVGCGTGTDALALARFGCRVTGVDRDARAVATARARARRARLPGTRARFVEGDAIDLPSLLGDTPFGAFDVIVDTLFANNLDRRGIRLYAPAVAAVARPGALILMQNRVWKRNHDRVATRRPPDGALAAWFDFGPRVSSAVPERPLRKRDPPFARVWVSVGRRNDRASPLAPSGRQVNA